MKKLLSAVALTLTFALAGAPSARAEEKLLGTVTKLEVNGGSAVATLKDSRSGALVDITVLDDLTLGKFKDHRISVGDEIKAKYEKRDGKNVSTYFKKPGGC